MELVQGLNIKRSAHSTCKPPTFQLGLAVTWLSLVTSVQQLDFNLVMLAKVQSTLQVLTRLRDRSAIIGGPD